MTPRKVLELTNYILRCGNPAVFALVLELVFRMFFYTTVHVVSVLSNKTVCFVL